jgi:aspartate aminotransferase
MEEKMEIQPLSRRIGFVQRSLNNFVSMISDPRFEEIRKDPDFCDFTAGNPQEMPVSGYVESLQRWLPPQNKDWFAYKTNESQAQIAVAESLAEWRKKAFLPEDIFLTTGAFSALALTLHAIIDPGDEVIYISPPWFFYEGLILSVGGVPVRVRMNPLTFDLDLNAIDHAISSRTRAIIINSPNNPTGKIYSASTLKTLGQMLTSISNRQDRPIFLLSDEAYSRIIYDGIEYASPTSYYGNTFLIYTYGKTLLAPGMRIGYIALPPEMENRQSVRYNMLTAQLIIGHAFPNALLQYALPDLEKLSIDVKHLEEKRDRMLEALNAMGYNVHTPEGAFYLLPRCPIEDDVAFCNLLMEYKIGSLPGSIMEMPGYFRLSLTASDAMIDRALPNFAKAMERVHSGEPIKTQL